MGRKLLSTIIASVLAVQPLENHAYSQDDGDAISISGNATVVSDYRFRGVSLSNGDIAIQGGFDIEKGGFSAGTWGSSIESFAGSELELDVYAGYGFDLGSDASLSLGAIAYTYPGSTDTAYYEGSAVLGRTVSGADISIGLAYAPSQANIGSQDNVYVFSDFSYAFDESPFSVAAHVGVEKGAFGDSKVDWLFGFAYSFDILSVGISYVDTNKAGDGLGGAVLWSIGAAY